MRVIAETVSAVRSASVLIFRRRPSASASCSRTHEKAPAPGGRLCQCPTEKQSERATSAGDRAEDPERLWTIRRSGERRGQQRQRGGGQQGSERALQSTCGDEHPERLGEASER